MPLRTGNPKHNQPERRLLRAGEGNLAKELKVRVPVPVRSDRLLKQVQALPHPGRRITDYERLHRRTLQLLTGRRHWVLRVDGWNGHVL